MQSDGNLLPFSIYTETPGKWKRFLRDLFVQRLDRGTSQARVTNPKACLPRRTPPDPQGCGDKRQLVPPRALSHPVSTTRKAWTQWNSRFFREKGKPRGTLPPPPLARARSRGIPGLWAHPRRGQSSRRRLSAARNALGRRETAWGRGRTWPRKVCGARIR